MKSRDSISSPYPDKPSPFFAIALTLLQALPWLSLAIFKISPVAFAAESIGYRYFHTYRLLHGDKSGIWLPQGQTLGVFHLGAQQSLDWIGITGLRDRLDLFGYGTLALNSLIFGGAIYYFNRVLAPGWIPRLLLAATSLFGIYGSRWGVIAGALPDYYTYEVTLTVLCLGAFLVGIEQTDYRLGWGGTALLGVLAGAMIGVKITLAPAALLPLLPYLMRSEDPLLRIARKVMLWGASAAITVTALLAAYYLFDFKHLFDAFQNWRSYLAAPGGEAGFLSSLRHPFTQGNKPGGTNHEFIVVIGVLWLIAVAAYFHGARAVRERRALFVLSLFVLVSSALHVLAVFKRPANTTLFESVLFLTAASSALLFVLPRHIAAYRRIAGFWLVVLLGWSGFSALKHFPSRSAIRDLRMTSRNAWEIHDWLNATGRPIIVLLPDNWHVSGSVEEILLKGFSQPPSWQITAGSDLLDRVAPRRSFISQLSAAPPGAVLLWTDVPDRAPLAPAPAASVLGSKPIETRSWAMQRFPYWRRTVHAAIFADKSGPASGATVLKSNFDWKDSTLASPLLDFSVSPGDAAAKIELRSENGRQTVRVTATKPGSYLAVSGGIPPLPNGAGPIFLQARVRASSARAVLWQIHDVVDATGAAKPVVEPMMLRANTWAYWAVQKPEITHATPADNFSVGIINVQPGDWFEVAELTLLLESR
jgi:hypothetical protein